MKRYKLFRSFFYKMKFFFKLSIFVERLPNSISYLESFYFKFISEPELSGSRMIIPNPYPDPDPAKSVGSDRLWFWIHNTVWYVIMFEGLFSQSWSRCAVPSMVDAQENINGRDQFRILVRAVGYTIHGLIPASCVFADRHHTYCLTYNNEANIRGGRKIVTSSLYILPDACCRKWWREGGSNEQPLSPPFFLVDP